MSNSLAVKKYVYSQTWILKRLPCQTIRFLTKLYTKKNDSGVEQNFRSQPSDNAFTLMLVWPVTGLSGDTHSRECVSMGQFTAKLAFSASQEAVQ